MARRGVGIASLVLGVVLAIIGFYLSTLSFASCVSIFGEGVCPLALMPFESTGLLVMGFGMALFLLGVVLIATARTKAT